MSLKPDFKRNAKFDRGDLLYGTSDSRGVYLRLAFPKTWGKKGHKYESYIDDYNNQFFCNTLADGFLDGDSMSAIIDQLNKKSGTYADILSANEKWSPQATLRMNPFNVMQKEGLLPLASKIAKDLEKLDPTSQNGKIAKRRIKDLMYKAYERKAIRRGCKFGLHMVAMDLNNDIPDAKIHFLLDEIDMESVIKKTTTDRDDLADGTAYKYIYITNTELRSVYRYWYVINQNKIFFYLNGEEVGPPWENAWKNKLDCHGKRQTNDPSWWSELVSQGKVHHGPTMSPRSTQKSSAQTTTQQSGFKSKKYQKIREKFERGNVK